jgi:hypothetical protein
MIENPCMPAKKAELDDQPGGDRRDAKQPRAKHRSDPAGPAAVLVGAERDQPRHPDGEQDPGPRRPAEAPSLEQRIRDRDDRPRQEPAAHEVRAAGLAVIGLGYHAGGRDQRDDRDRNVDEEDRAPRPTEEVRVGEHAAEDQAERRGEPEHRAVGGERLAALFAGEDRAEGREELRDHHCRRRSLKDAGHDQLPRALGQPAGEAGHAEQRDPAEEDALAPELVAEAAGDDQRRREGEHVGGDDPLELGPARPQVAADRRQGDVHDREVDQVHHRGADHHGGGEPSPRIGVGRRGGVVRRGGPFHGSPVVSGAPRAAARIRGAPLDPALRLLPPLELEQLPGDDSVARQICVNGAVEPVAHRGLLSRGHASSVIRGRCRRHATAPEISPHRTRSRGRAIPTSAARGIGAYWAAWTGARRR